MINPILTSRLEFVTVGLKGASRCEKMSYGPLLIDGGRSYNLYKLAENKWVSLGVFCFTPPKSVEVDGPLRKWPAELDEDLLQKPGHWVGYRLPVIYPLGDGFFGDIFL